MTHIECFEKKSSDKPEKEKNLLSRCAAQVLGGLALLSHVCYSKLQISLSKFLGSQPGKWWIKKRLSWEGVGSQGAERKWFRSQQAAPGPGLDFSWSHQVSHFFLKAGLGYFACFQFSTISSTAGISSQPSHREVWPLSSSFQPEPPSLPTWCHRGTGKQLHTQKKHSGNLNSPPKPTAQTNK